MREKSTTAASPSERLVKTIRRVTRKHYSAEEKKLSIAALSQTLPERLMLQTTPWSAIRRWNCSLVY